MTSRDRVLKTLAFKEADRVPIDNNGCVSGMHEAAYKNLLHYMGLEDDIKIYDPVQKLALVKKEIRDMLGIDTWYLWPNPPSNYKYKEDEDGTFADEFGTVYKRVGYYYEIYKPPLKG